MSRLRKLFLAALAVGVACLVGYWIFIALASEETRIRWRIEGMRHAFNNARAGGCTDGLAEDFVHENSRLGKEEVRASLVYIFLKERHPKTREFLFRVDLPEEAIQIRVLPPDRRKADVELKAMFSDLRTHRSVWEVHVEANLEKGDDGWQVKRARHRTLAGKRPWSF